MSSANRAVLVIGICGMSLMYMENKCGPNIEPWGTPAVINVGVEFEWFSET